MQELHIWYSGLNKSGGFNSFSYFISKITNKFHCCHPLVASGHALIKTLLWIHACGCLFMLIGGWEWKIKHMAAYLTNAQCHFINICEIHHEFRPETHLELFYFVNKGTVGKKKSRSCPSFCRRLDRFRSQCLPNKPFWGGIWPTKTKDKINSAWLCCRRDKRLNRMELTVCLA